MTKSFFPHIYDNTLTPTPNKGLFETNSRTINSNDQYCINQRFVKYHELEIEGLYYHEYVS